MFKDYFLTLVAKSKGTIIIKVINIICSKTIKIYKEDENATIETNPITDFKVEYD